MRPNAYGIWHAKHQGSYTRNRGVAIGSVNSIDLVRWFAALEHGTPGWFLVCIPARQAEDHPNG
jgi:hypothetical protein